MIFDEHVLKTPRHETFYLASGPRDAPLMIFAHGWPELSLSWRHQLKHFGERGWRAIAPDMRGYGRSTVHRRHEDYALEESVADMLELLAHLGREQAIWVGHDGGTPSRLATVRRDGGWFGGKGAAPDVPMDRDLLTEEDLDQYAAALEKNGFFGPDSWYMNPERNIAYGKRALNGGRLSMPVLFFHGLYDYTCETVRSTLAAPMREYCKDLTEVTVPSGHWMAQEKPELVNAGLASWLAARFS